MNKTILVSLLFAVACGKGGGGAAKMKTVDLGDSGYVIDVPDGWSVEVPMKGFFELKGGRPSPQLMQSPIAPPSLDELVANRCEGRTVQTKETLPGGGVFVSCKGESKMIKGITTTQIAAYVPMGEHESLMCHLETDKDVDTVSKICKSMRKK